MNVIQCDVEETEGKTKDTVTHSTGGPGGCISIVTHEQYREVERNVRSGVITPTMSISYQQANFFEGKKQIKPESTLSPDECKPSDKIRNMEQLSVCTSTGDLDSHCKQQTQKIEETPLKCLVLRNRIGNKRTEATQTENSFDRKDASTSIRRKNKGKKEHKTDKTKNQSNNKGRKNKKTNKCKENFLRNKITLLNGSTAKTVNILERNNTGSKSFQELQNSTKDL